MGGDGRHYGSGRGAGRCGYDPVVPREDPKERVDRELIELLNELRVALPGVQVLFAFLLILPFTQGFERITALQRAVFVASVLFTAVASVLLIAPSSYHRLRFRQRDKERMLFTSNKLAIVGMIALAAAMTLTVFLVTDVVLNDLVAALFTAAVAVTFGWFWYGLPLSRRVPALQDEPEGEDPSPADPRGAG